MDSALILLQTGGKIMPYTHVQYTHIRFIAYCIYTAPDKSGNKKIYKGIPPQKHRKKEDIDARINEKEDIDARINLVGKAIEKAEKTLGAEEKTLNIFMMPEFFFRGSTGAYEMNDVQYIISELHKLVHEEKWKDWLFVFGTIVGKSYKTEYTKDKVEIVPEANLEVYNFTLVQKGYFILGDEKDPQKIKGDEKDPQKITASEKAHVVIKEFMSGIDFIEKANISNDNLSLDRVIHMDRTNLLRPTTEKQAISYDGSSIFTIDGIKFGLEVCLDHSQKRLANSREAIDNQSGIVDIQLIPSCGMTIMQDAIVVRNGGYIFNCDGLGDNKINFHSTLFKKCDSNGKPYSSINALQKEELQFEGKFKGIIEEIYARGAGELHIYPRQELPQKYSEAKGASLSLFSYSPSHLTTALSNEPILINRMKVIFDRSVSVYPVSLQSKITSTQLGNFYFSYGQGWKKKFKIGDQEMGWQPKINCQLIRYATAEEKEQLDRSNGEYKEVSHHGHARSAVWFFDPTEKYEPDFAKDRPCIFTIEFKVDDIPARFISSEDPNFEGEAMHPDQVIVKNNEIGAYGIGRNLIDNFRINIEYNQSLKEKGVTKKSRNSRKKR
ncbi:hypothetical protein NWP21_01275 [Anabaenopsis sp. FSS-46]|uniref:hypothetical protein n=1 Tax=Anabaenopsis sp. FSS-46 TaxID=2971766 RepID=UPI002474E0CC|nr:hypothetical protein [Anabaenopsis sp. FSS-46]MDH6097495.1 hypothetical protein [Anabaenopsis sp. FSS-46]